jgi:hypothetical protein
VNVLLLDLHYYYCDFVIVGFVEILCIWYYVFSYNNTMVEIGLLSPPNNNTTTTNNNTAINDNSNTLLIREINSNYYTWDGGIVGPASNKHLLLPIPLEFIICDKCNISKHLLAIIYAPVDTCVNAFHRDLNIIICFQCKQIECLRTQLAQINDIYPSHIIGSNNHNDDDDDEEDDILQQQIIIPPPDRSKWNQFQQFGELTCPRGILVESLSEDDDENDSNDNDNDDDQSLSKQGMCKICGIMCKTRCTACKQVFYCSVQHQRQDWQQKPNGHKKLCEELQMMSQKDVEQLLKEQGLLAKNRTAMDKTFMEFQNHLKRAPTQVLRYSRWFHQDSKPIWPHKIQSEIDDDVEITKCQYCNSSRKFECQIMPHIWSCALPRQDMDLGLTLAIYTCVQSCGPSGSITREVIIGREV